MNKRSILILFAFILIIPSLMILGAGISETSAANSAVYFMSDVYTCPMHPEVVSDKPGTCPKCGMDLVLKKDSDVQNKKQDRMNNMQSDGCCGNNMKTGKSGCNHNMSDDSKTDKVQSDDDSKMNSGNHDHGSGNDGCMGH